jgi:hypothetical protein
VCTPLFEAQHKHRWRRRAATMRNDERSRREEEDDVSFINEATQKGAMICDSPAHDGNEGRRDFFVSPCAILCDP